MTKSRDMAWEVRIREVQPGREPILGQPGGTDYSVAFDLLLFERAEGLRWYRLQRNHGTRRDRETIATENWTRVQTQSAQAERART